jgi:Holliday junction resolvase RusA-like endonuclease
LIAFTVPGEAVPFARAGARGKQRFTPGKQRNAMGVVAHLAQRAMAGQPPFLGALRMTVRAVYLVPESWSKKKREAAKWKSSYPDADNIGKLIKDALNKVVYVDDAQIAELTVQKVYGPIAGVTVTVERLEPLIGGSKDFAFRAMPERESAEGSLEQAPLIPAD